MPKYRFKTKEEFIKEYGENWRGAVLFNGNGKMDYLIGKPYPYGIEKTGCILPIKDDNLDASFQKGSWLIYREMLTEIKEPNYKPRKLIKE